MKDKWYGYLRLYWYLWFMKPVVEADNRLRKWERKKWEDLYLRYAPSIRRWFYLTFRIRCNRYPSRHELFSLALKAGAIVRREFGKELEADWKEDHTPVTQVDQAISRLYLQKMGQRFKHISVVGEEDWPRMGESTTILVLDERDGTIPGMLGVTAATIVATVAVKGEPISTLIHDPILRRSWYAEQGKGAFCWRGGWFQWFRIWVSDMGLGFLFQDRGLGRRLHVSDQPLEDSINSLMWWADSEGNLDDVRPQLNEISGAQWHNFCAVAISGGLIAEGKMVASIFGGRHPRETIAMQLLVVEAGGFATDLFGGRLVYKVSRHADDFGQLLPIRGHIITNTRENLFRILIMVAQVNRRGGVFVPSDETLELVMSVQR